MRIVIIQFRTQLSMILLALFFALGVIGNFAHAQGDSGDGYEVGLSIANFGVGGIAREGDWVGIQVQVLDHGSEARDLILRIGIRDQDGDDALYDRVITANPGMQQSFWLYCWIPFRSQQLDFEVKAYEAKDAGNAQSGGLGFDTGALVGRVNIYSPRIEPSTVAIAGIVGNNSMGIDQYGVSVGNRLAIPFGHELIRGVKGLGIEHLPDRWHGLSSMDTLVWEGAGSASTDPSRLSPEKARAIRNWVQRGGHLVIVMPSAGDPWYAGSHPLGSVLPRIKVPRRHEGVDLERHRSLITESKLGKLPDNAVMHSFESLDDQEPTQAIRVIETIDGDCVAIRRLVGSGMVTLIGLPINHGQLQRIGLPDAESWWHRILGLRGEVYREVQLSDEQKSDAGDRVGVAFDDQLAGSIDKTGRAVQGVLFGVIVFVLYWIVAGPGGYGLLRAKDKKHHAWVFFVGSIGLFTAIAWLGATALRPKSTNISHFTMLESVHGQENSRSRTWMSIMLPSYGHSAVSVDDPAGEQAFKVDLSGNVLLPWVSPDSLGTLTQGFPDNSGYRIESRNPNVLRVPTRATVKTFQADWSGALSSAWGMPRPIGVPGAIGEPKLTLSGTVVSGTLVHQLPGALHDVRIFVLGGQVPILQAGQSLGRRQIARAAVFAPKVGIDGWMPGESLEMETPTRVVDIKANARLSGYFGSAMKFGVDQSSALGRTTGTIVDRMIAGRFISQLEPPRYGATNDVVGNRLALRRTLHGWDLGRWFTQPTLIIVGVLEVKPDEADPNAMPTPIWVDGKRVDASGQTIVTWIYSFEPSPPGFIGGVPQRRSNEKTNDTNEQNDDASVKEGL